MITILRKPRADGLSGIQVFDDQGKEVPQVKSLLFLPDCVEINCYVLNLSGNRIINSKGDGTLTYTIGVEYKDLKMTWENDKNE